MERRRFLAIVMTVMMVISLIPSMVFAAAPSGELGGKLKVKGLAAVGVTVSADYSKVTPEGVTDEDFTFSWLRQTGEKELTQIGTEKTYTITQEDLGYKLELDITPIDRSGLTGMLTAKTLEVAATEEEAKALAEQNPDDTEEAQLTETTDEAENNQDSENQTTDETQTDENQNVENSQNDEVQETEGQLDETQTDYNNESAQQTDGSQETASDQTYNETDSTEGTDDSQMKIYTEEQLQVDENGNVQTDKTDENAEDTAEKDSKEAYEAVASVEDSEDPVCDFGTAQSDLEDVEAQYVQITNTGSETLNFQEISPEHFMVADITEPLAAGESVNVWVQPREGLEAGDYDDVITYETEEGTEVSFEAKITVEGGSTDADDEDLEPVEDPKEEPADTTEPTETPDDSKASDDSKTSDDTEAPASDDNTDASLEAQSLDVNTGTLNFSDVEENYTQANETLSVTVTNTGDSAVTLNVPQSDYFDVLNEDGSEAVSGTQLAKGDSIMFMVQPKTGLAKGDYSDTLVFGSNEDSEVTAQVTAEISVKEAQQQITEIQAAPASVTYDNLKEGYATPDSTTVTLTNTGNTTVSLVQPVGEYFNIGELSASELKPGDTAEFTVTPVAGLTAGDYMDSIQIMQTNADGQEEVLTTVNASITVSEVEKVYKLSVDPTELDFGNTKAGYSEAPKAQKVTVTNKGNTNVTLNTPTAKNFKIGKFSAAELAPGESATFKIRPKEGLKAGSYTEAITVNTDQNISAKVNVKFTVKTVRKAKIADPADNKITGISSDGYTTQSKITFTAVGAGMDNESPGKGDVRYVPYNWKVINTNSWSSAPYTAAFGITKAGTYTLTVVFDRQMYNGKEWENTGEQDTKQVNFNITQAQTVTATPTPQPNGATAKSAVKTGDTTNIAPFVIILVIAAGCIAGVVVYKKKKK